MKSNEELIKNIETFELNIRNNIIKEIVGLMKSINSDTVLLFLNGNSISIKLNKDNSFIINNNKNLDQFNLKELLDIYLSLKSLIYDNLNIN